jgi:hypothetical protein
VDELDEDGPGLEVFEGPAWGVEAGMSVEEGLSEDEEIDSGYDVSSV